ncbi:hypothetical protein HY798_03605 [Candidatus Falkowbacteria bacterium]|nr:hypothetical protein [Candidatus Falkowbacteria bacterium]
MQNQLQRIINLAKKTGDRVIVFSASKPDDAYVVMDLDQYEKLAVGKSDLHNLTEDELLDKINRDVAIWKSEHDFSAFNDNFFSKDDDNDNNDNEDRRMVEERQRENFYLSGARKKQNEQNERERRERKEGKKVWAIPTARKKAAEDIIEEDRQYLEEIKF